MAVKNSNRVAQQPSLSAPAVGAFEFCARFVLRQKARLPSLAEFEDAIFNAGAYPRMGRFLGIPVDLFEKSVVIKPRNAATDLAVIYHITSSNELFSITSRHYVIGLQVSDRTADAVTLSWDLIPHYQQNGLFVGEYAGVLNAAANRALYTPVNAGYWRYVRSESLIDFKIQVDPGAPVTHPKLMRKVLTIFPQELLRDRCHFEQFETIITL